MATLSLFSKHASERLREGTMFIIWTNKSRVSVMEGQKKLDSSSMRPTYHYTLFHITKNPLLGLFGYKYRISKKSFTRDTKCSFLREQDKRRYFSFDGNTFSDLIVQKHPSTQTTKPKTEQEMNDYKRIKYVQEIMQTIKNRQFMESWLKSDTVRGELAYKTIKFLWRAGIDPDNLVRLESNSNQSNRFSAKIKNKILQEWKSKKGNRWQITPQIELIRDCVGLWTVSSDIKSMYFKEVDFIHAYNIEHIVSNSFGVDNSDWRNGVVLDEKINKRKGNRMLFLYWDDVATIRKQRKLQSRFLFWFRINHLFKSLVD